MLLLLTYGLSQPPPYNVTRPRTIYLHRRTSFALSALLADETTRADRSAHRRTKQLIIEEISLSLMLMPLLLCPCAPIIYRLLVAAAVAIDQRLRSLCLLCSFSIFFVSCCRHRNGGCQIKPSRTLPDNKKKRNHRLGLTSEDNRKRVLPHSTGVNYIFRPYRPWGFVLDGGCRNRYPHHSTTTDSHRLRH